ncbi:energy transducer TonB, partial [Xanthomonas perforans]
MPAPPVPHSPGHPPDPSRPIPAMTEQTPAPQIP